MGVGAKAKSRYAWSFGYSSEASGVGSIAFGSRATAKGTSAIAIGSGNYDQPNGGAQAYSEDAIVIGRGAKAGNEDDTEIASNTVAIGANAKAVRVYTGKKINDAVLIGANTQVTRERGIAVGANAYVDGASGAAFGDYASVIADEGLAIGKKAKIAYNSTKSVAIGSGAEVQSSETAVAVGTGAVVGGNSSDAIAIGTGAKTQEGAKRSIVIGKGSVVKGYDSVAIGTNASTGLYNSVAIGNGAQATLSDGIALGSDSKTTVSSGNKGYDPYKNTFNIDAHPGAAWESTKAALSVGDVGNNITRQITSVAAGRNDTDAVNVAQLKKLRDYTDTKMNIDLGNITPKGIDKVKDWAQEAIAVKSKKNDYLGIEVSNSASSPNRMTYYLSPTQEFYKKMKAIDELDRRTTELEEGWDLKLTTETEEETSAVEALDVVEFGVANADSGLTVTRETTDAETDDHWGKTKPIRKHTIKFGIDSAKLVENINKGDTAVTNISAKFSVAGKDSANADTTKAVNLGKEKNNAIKFLGTDKETTVTVGGADDAPTVTVGLAKTFKDRVGTNETNIGNLQRGFTVKDGGTGTADVKLGEDANESVIFKAAVDKTTAATADTKSLSSSVDANRNVTYTLNMSQLKKDLGITDGPDGVMSSWKLKATGGDTTEQDIKNGEAVTFDASGNGLTVKREGKTIKYGIDGSKIDIANNQSITNLGKRIDNLPSIHYFSVKSTATGAGSNYDNDGATGVSAIAIGQKAKSEGYGAVAMGTSAHTGANAHYALALGMKSDAAGFANIAIGNEAKAQAAMYATAIGQESVVTKDQGIAIGTNAQADAESGISIGVKAKSLAYRGIAVGINSTVGATGRRGIAIGEGSYVGEARPNDTTAMPKPSDEWKPTNPYESVDDNTKPKANETAQEKAMAVGFNAGAFGYQTTALGAGAQAHDSNTTAVGVAAVAKGHHSTALGMQARTFEKESTSVGHWADSRAEFATALGSNTIVYKKGGVALGFGARAYDENSIAIGSNSFAKEAIDGKAYLSDEEVKAAAGIVSVGNPAYKAGDKDFAANYRRIVNVAGGIHDNDAVNVAQLKALEGKVTDNNGDITTLKEGWTLEDAAGSKKVVKATNTVKVKGDDYITATVDNDGLKLGMDETKLNKQINNQIDNSETVKAKMNSWVLKATSDKDAEKDGKTINNDNNAVTFDATGNGLTVTRDGSTIKYGIDGSKIDITGNKSITDLQTEIKESKTTVEAAANSQITVTPETQSDKSTKYVVDIAKDGTIDGDKDGNLVTGKTVKDYVDANKVTVTDDGVSGVKVKNIAETGKPANYQVSLGDKIKAGDVTVDGTKGAGQITGLSNTTWNADNIVSGRAATEDQLKAVSQNAAEAAKKHTTVVAGDYVTVSEGTNDNGGKEYTVNGPKVAVAKDEKNLVVGDIMDGDKKVGYELKLNKELTGLTSVSSDTFKSGEDVTINKDGLTIKEGPSVTTKGIDAGKKKITNVADGDVSENSTDAVNGGQLYKLQQTVAGNKVTVEAAKNSQITVTSETQSDKSTKYVVDIAKDGTIDGDKDDNLVTGKTVKDYVDANKVTVTDDGVSGVKVENTAKTGEPANYKVSLGDKIKAGDVTVDGTKGAGQITGLSNTKWDADKIVSGRAATEDQLKAVSQNAAAEAAKKQTTLVAGDYVTVSEGTNTAGGKEYTVTGPKLAVVDGEENLVVGDITEGNKKVGYNLKLNKELKGLTSVSSDTFKSGDKVTINNEGLTIKDGPSVTTKGIDAGGKTIANVADGKADTDAVNVRQLNAIASQGNQNIAILGGKVSELNGRVDRVGAGAAALAALHPLDFDPDDKWDFAAGYGNYSGANAVAIGAYYRPNEDTMFSVGGSFGGGENMVNAGVSVKLGQGNNVTTSKIAMAKEIKDLRAEVEVLRQAIVGVGQGQELDPMKMKLFPDIEKNHWAYEAVEELAKQGLLEGYPDGTFRGDRMMTRYEFAEVVYRAMQKGLKVNEKLIQEFEPELERFRIDVISKDKDGNPVIERVRVNDKKDVAETANA